MLIRLLPIAIVLIAVALILLSRSASRKRGETFFAAAGLSDAPAGTPLALHGQKRPTRIVDGVFVSVGLAKTRTRNPETLVGTRKRHEGADTYIEKETVTTTTHLWIVYPQAYPFPFAFTASPGEQPLFEGEYDDMSDLLGTDEVAGAAETLLTALAAQSGSLRMDETMIDISLPEDATVQPQLTEAALHFWRAVRDGSRYPYRAQ